MPSGGYGDPGYASSLAEFGAPLALARSGGTVLARPIPGSDARDVMGPYPLFSCDDWSALSDDLAALDAGLVSVALVADPFGGWTPELLQDAFPDRCQPFKDHFVVALDEAPLAAATRHHRRDAARALRRVDVERLDHAPALLDDWDALYSALVERHEIRGVAAFSRASFERQLALPGLIAFRATKDGELVGAALWLTAGEVAHYHLAASTEPGYAMGVSYALVATALEHFAAAGLEWANLGAGAGLSGAGDDGLTRFKAGWATGTRTAFFCGRILDAARYADLAQAAGTPGARFFPAYRAAEYGGGA